MNAAIGANTPLSDRAPEWYYRHSFRRSVYGRRKAHLFTSITQAPDSFGTILDIAASPPLCQRVDNGFGDILDRAGRVPPSEACRVCLRIGRRLGLVPAQP